MKGRDLLKRTPFRLAATFSIVFTSMLVVVLSVIYFGITARLTSDIKERVTGTAKALAALDDQKSFDDLVDAVSSESASVRDSDFIFELVDDKGVFLAGNVRDIPQSRGWLNLRRSDVFMTFERGEPDDSFSAIWTDLSKGRLLVGTSNREVRQTQSYLLKVFGAGFLLTAMAVAAVATHLARQAQGRIRVFSDTLAAIKKGAIATRVPMLGSGDDIDQVAQQVNGALAHLQRLIENVNQSSSDIAHDLKKPIGRLRQRLESIDTSVSSEREVHDSIEAAISELDQITSTFDALLRITQIEAGARRSRFAEVDLGALLEEVYEVYAPVADDAGYTLRVESPRAKRCLCLGDAELITQLIANLIENAIQHCPKGTRIEMRLRQTDRGSAITVSDNGPGIPEIERENVFRRLYRLEQSRTTPGHGLGLSLVSAIADLHHASVTLTDNGPGLSAEIAFPNVSEG